MTNKFLDKRKDINSYQHQAQPLAAVHINEDLQEIKEERFHQQKSTKKKSKKHLEHEADFNLTEDEMSVNTINR